MEESVVNELRAASEKAKSKECHVLCLFDFAATTGFATVSQNIIANLTAHYGSRLKLTIVAINYFGMPYNETENILVFPATRSTLDPKASESYGRLGFLKLLKEDDYDGIFIIQDPGAVLPMVPDLRKIQKEKKDKGIKPFKSIFYFPVDGPIIKEGMMELENFAFFDIIVAYTEYARQQLLSAMPKLVDKKIKVILHGINPKHFYPIEGLMQREALMKFREQYFGDNWLKYIVTNVNRNQPRKDIPTTIFGFEEFKKQWNNSAKYLDGASGKQPFLYLHMTPNDNLGWNLPRVLRQTSLKEGVDYMFPPEAEYNAQTSIERLNLIYNASDIFLTTTTGEGFGLTVLEAMACKLPVIAPLHTALIEVCGDGSRVFPLKDFYPYCTHFDHDIRYQSSIENVADTLMFACNNNLREKKALKLQDAYEYSQRLTWQNVCERWIELFDIIVK